jgi:hypothetical protein
MSRKRARTGLTKQREVEGKLREASWRAKGGALGAGADRQMAMAAGEARAVSDAWGLDVRVDPLEDIAVLASLLRIAGDRVDDALRTRATEAIVRLMIHHDDGANDTGISMGDPVRALRTFVEGHKGSMTQAAEIAVEKYALPASSFESAVKTLKQRLGKKRP